MSPQQLLAKIITDLEASDYPAAAGDAAQLIAIELPNLIAFFAGRAKSKQSHAPLSREEAINVLKTQLALPAINWGVVWPIILAIAQSVLPLLHIV